MGHLGRARKNLDADSEVINMQVARRQEAAQKNVEESKRVAKLQRTLSVEQKEKELILRDTMLLRKTKSNLQSRTATWKKLQSPLAHCLVTTTTEPTISWLPKSHNEMTRALLDKRKLEMEEAILRRESDDAEKLRVAEEAMVTAREGILEAQRRKNAEWEARQEVLDHQGGANGRREEEGGEGGEQKHGQEDISDEDEREQANEAEEEEEEEEDILAVLDGRIRARKSAETEKEVMKETTPSTEDEANSEKETELEENSTTASEPVVTTTITSTSDDSNSKDENGDDTVPDNCSGNTNELGQSKENASGTSSKQPASGREKFDYEAEATSLALLTVAQLKAVGADEGVAFRKGKMLKKYYVEDICQARKQKRGE